MRSAGAICSSACARSCRRRRAAVIVRSIVLVLTCGFAVSLNAQTAQTPAPTATVFHNVRIFNGKGGQLSGPSHVLVRGNTIERISSTPIATTDADAVVIEGGGR